MILQLNSEFRVRIVIQYVVLEILIRYSQYGSTEGISRKSVQLIQNALATNTADAQQLSESNETYSKQQLQQFQSDASALLSFKAALDLKSARLLVPGWTTMSNSSSATSPCNWLGVSCSRITFLDANISMNNAPTNKQQILAVVSLNLPELSLSGSIAPNIAKLKYLSFLNLSANLLTGAIPSSIHELKFLKTLDLHKNQFIGSVPDSKSLPLSLKLLDLSWNNFTGYIPPSLSELRGLRMLQLHNIPNLSGPIPVSLTTLPKIKHLCFGTNNLSGPLPPQLSNLNATLIDFAAYENKFSGHLPPQLGSLHHLRSLKLFNIDFNGSIIPPEFGNLTSLVYLYLFNCNLKGSIPSSIGNLNRLRVLDLSANPFSGSIPSSIGQLFRLEELHLYYHTSLSGSIPPEIGNLKTLKLLFLSNTNISGSIPSEIGKLQKLSILFLDSNRLSGPIPASMSQMRSLQELHLYNNNITGPIPLWLGNLKNISYLYLHFNSLVGSIPKELSRLSNLVTLNLQMNKLEGEIPPELGNLTNLQNLYLQSNRLTGAIPPELGKLKNLIGLGLSHNRFNEGIPETFGMLENLLYLDAEDAQLSGTIPDSLGKMKNITYLQLSNNHLNGSLPLSLSKCSKLQWLKLKNNSLSGEIPSVYTSFPFLQTISLNDNKLTGKLPSNFINSSALVVIDLKRNQFTGFIPESWSALKHLRVLILSYNQLQGPLPGWLWTLSELQVIDLSNNFFQGNISEDITHLQAFKQKQSNTKNNNDKDNLYNDDVNLNVKNTILTFDHTLSAVVSLDLSRNQLNGSIPHTIGDLLSIYSLNVSSNRLDGSIPRNLSKCLELESLDLSLNNLSGPLPTELNDLSYLGAFNVSYNNLSGKIPQGGHLSTFSNMSYIGNPGLCGYPLEPCPNVSQINDSSYQAKPKGEGETVKYVIVGAAVICLSLAIVCCFASHKWWKKPRACTPVFHLFDNSLKGMKRELLQSLECGCNESSLIGRGGSGIVFKVVLSNGKIIALKKIILALSSKEAMRCFRTEIEILGRVRHRNVLKLLAACSRPSTMLSCIFDFMPNKSLEDHLYPTTQGNNGLIPLSWRIRCKIAIGVAQGLRYLHSDTGFGQVLHLDLKPSNILLDDDFEPRISDFGISQILMDGTQEVASISQFRGTFGYAAPEATYLEHVTDRADVYSFGVLILELVTCKRPTSTNSFNGQPDLRTWVATTLGGVVDPNEASAELHLLLDKSLLDCSDASEKDQMVQVLYLGLWCTNLSSSNRPTMIQVVEKIIKIVPSCAKKTSVDDSKNAVKVEDIRANQSL